MYKILKILFLFTFLFISCDIHNSHFNESWFEVKETTNVKDFRYKNQALICVIEEDNGSILFKNNDVFHFSSIKEKTSVQFNNLEIILIPEKPFCIITYDDAPALDYDIYMIHKLYTPTVPAEIGIILSGFGLDKEDTINIIVSIIVLRQPRRSHPNVMSRRCPHRCVIQHERLENHRFNVQTIKKRYRCSLHNIITHSHLRPHHRYRNRLGISCHLIHQTYHGKHKYLCHPR